MDALEMMLDVCVLVDYVLLAKFAVVLVDHLPHLAKLGSIVLDEKAVCVPDVVLVDAKGGEGLAAEHAEVLASLRPALRLVADQVSRGGGTFNNLVAFHVTDPQALSLGRDLDLLLHRSCCFWFWLLRCLVVR